MEQSSSWEANSTLSYSWKSLHFMELKGLLHCSQEPATGPYPKPNKSNPHSQTLFH
jgi:hypothetical protein